MSLDAMKLKKAAFDLLLDALTDELIGMTDEQVLAGEDPALVLAQGRDLLAKARSDAGMELKNEP